MPALRPFDCGSDTAPQRTIVLLVSPILTAVDEHDPVFAVKN